MGIGVRVAVPVTHDRAGPGRQVQRAVVRFQLLRDCTPAHPGVEHRAELVDRFAGGLRPGFEANGAPHSVFGSERLQLVSRGGDARRSEQVDQPPGMVIGELGPLIGFVGVVVLLLSLLILVAGARARWLVRGGKG
jgi:hypothetical protein